MEGTISKNSGAAHAARPVPAPATAAPVKPEVSTLSIVLALLAIYIIWGSTYLAIRMALLGGFPPFALGATRFIIAGVAMYLFLRWRGAPNPTRREWLSAAAVGILLLVGGNGMVMVAEQWVASGLAALAVGAVPIWAVLFAGLWGRWPIKLEWFGLLLGFAGVVLLNLEGDMRANPWGAAALIFATASWAFGSVWSKHLHMPGGMMSSAAQMLVAGVAMLGLSFGLSEKFAAVPTTDAFVAAAYLIVFGSIIGFSAYVFLLKNVRPSMATSYAYVNPVVAVGLGVWLGSENITLFGLAAMGVILAGVAIVMVAKGKSA
ncbi:MAG TPA: drug/metabolite exporter YedA [Chloroflexia bacterium]|nr:drug/metabolite exporter YedA [Chloroflexia bacterium]